MPRKMNFPAATSGSKFQDFKSFTLSTVACSKHTDSETLDGIARRGEFDLCLLVAANCKTATATLEWIVDCGMPEFRKNQRGEELVRRLAEHKAISIASIATLLGTYDGLCPSLLDILAGNRFITAQALEEIAASGDVHVRRLAARHPNTPTDALHRVFESYFPATMEPGSSEHVRFMTSGQARHSQKVLVPLAKNPAAPKDILCRLADHSLLYFLSATHALNAWSALLANPAFCGNARMDLLARLLEYSSGLEIAGQTFTLVDISEDDARRFIAGLSAEYVGLLLMVDVSFRIKRLSKQKKARAQNDWGLVHQMIAESPDMGHRILIAMSRNVSQDVLRTLAKDPETSVRLKVAGNQNAPRDVLTLLSTDPDRAVRDATLRTLQMYWLKDDNRQTSD